MRFRERMEQSEGMSEGEGEVGWDKLFSQYCYMSKAQNNDTSLLKHLLTFPHTSLKEQVHALGSISNYHKWVSLRKKGGFISKNNKVRLIQHLLFHPQMKRDKQGNFKPCYVPSSPRNQLMFFALNCGCDDWCMKTMIHILQHDLGQKQWCVLHNAESTNSASHIQNSSVVDDVEFRATAPKRRKYSARVVSGSAQDILRLDPTYDGSDVPFLTSAVTQRSQFINFTEELFTKGQIHWRKHSEDENIVVMNDYSSSTGQLKTMEFVHVKATITAPDECLVECSCRIYQIMKGAALKDIRLEHGEEAVLDAKFTCMHCRFYNTHLAPIQNSLHAQDNLSKLQLKVQESIGYSTDDKVLLLGLPFPQGTTKFSVCSSSCESDVDDSYSVVNIHFTKTQCFGKCLSGHCQSLFKCRKRIPKGVSMEVLRASGGLCPHLDTILSKLFILEEMFPHFFGYGDPGAFETDMTNMDDIPLPLASEDSNTDDTPVRDYNSGNIKFDAETGYYLSSSHSQYVPKQNKFDDVLRENTYLRLQAFAKPPLPNGLFSFHPVSPMTACCINDDGSPIQCICGATFSTFSFLCPRKVRVYCRDVSI